MGGRGGSQRFRPCQVLPAVADGGCVPPREDPGSSNPVYPPSRSACSQQLQIWVVVPARVVHVRVSAATRHSASSADAGVFQVRNLGLQHGCGPAQGCCAPADLQAGSAPAEARRAAVGACSSPMLQGNTEELRQEPCQASRHGLALNPKASI